MPISSQKIFQDAGNLKDFIFIVTPLLEGFAGAKTYVKEGFLAVTVTA